MTARQAERLLRTWQRRLGLAHWEITFEVAQLEPITAAAEVDVGSNYEDGRIRVQPWALAGEPPEEVRQPVDLEATIVHELLHLSVRPLRRAAALLEETNSLHRDVQRMFDESWIQREEEAVDRLAVALVRAWRAEGRQAAPSTPTAPRRRARGRKAG